MALALYRTYRPGSLAEVIGQEHVTEPLGRALASGRIHHAYLLSGPRGCGKTSTARILARSLNCAEGPTAQPCGTCRSCVELAPNGPGSIDVVELDAATHRGIDDARELREKAIYAPAASRYKVYIIDEAHQLTNEAANALLKLVEEPPPHLRFIFATTEPDRIIPTIRSRTFHYGFRLVPARVLAEHLAGVCRAEGVPAEPAALAVVARAGAGSVRDSMSVLGQLIAGTGPDGLTYADAVASLGLTDASLIDAFVEALSGASAAQMFLVVDSVISAGHDPRRFVADVLDRLRDLLVLRADPSAVSRGLLDVPDDAAERMMAQATSLGLAELSRAADLVSAGLGEIKGATAPRLQLELLCARLALPAVERDAGALLARIDQLERGVAGARSSSAPPAAAPATRPAPVEPAAQVEPVTAAAPSAAERPAPPPPAPTGGSGGAVPAPPRRPTPRAPAAPRPAPAGATPDPAPVGAQPAPAGSQPGRGPSGAGDQLARIQAEWPRIMERLAASSRVAWTAFHSATPVSVSEGVLAVALAEPGIVRAIAQRGHDERLRQVIIDVLQVDVAVDVLHHPDAVRAAPATDAPARSADQARPADQARAADRVRAARAPRPGHAQPDDVASVDDPDLGPIDGLSLITRELGARPIGEIDHS